MFKHIILPVDGSELSLKAVETGLAFAKSIGAKVTLFHVVPHFSLPMQSGFQSEFTSELVRKLEKEREEEYRKAGDKMLEDLQKRARLAGVESDTAAVIGNSPYESIISETERRGCDLIMMASHGRRGLNAVLLGSETAKVLTHTKIPVLVVR